MRKYAFPPFALVGRCLRQLLDQNVSHLVLVAPVWQSQPWYPLLLELCVAPPILFPHYPGLLTRQGEVHPLLNPQLAGELLSANHIQKQAFHNQLKTLLVAAWRNGTSKAYASAWLARLLYLRIIHLILQAASGPSIICDFLTLSIWLTDGTHLNTSLITQGRNTKTTFHINFMYFWPRVLDVKRSRGG